MWYAAICCVVDCAEKAAVHLGLCSRPSSTMSQTGAVFFLIPQLIMQSEVRPFNGFYVCGETEDIGLFPLRKMDENKNISTLNVMFRLDEN